MMLMVAGFFVNPPNALAGVAGSAGPSYPSVMSIGDSDVAVSIQIINNSSDPHNSENIIVDDIFHTPSCASSASSICQPANADPGVFEITGSVIGRLGTACAGTTFIVGTPDAITGEVKLTPNTPLILGPTGSPDAQCIIDFHVNVLKAPTKDSNLELAGISTAQLARARFTSQQTVLEGSAAGSSRVTIDKSSPTISTIPSAGGVIGTVINDTAALSGGSNPTGDVVFKLYAPTDPTCSGTPVWTQTDTASPYATTGEYTSLMAGTYNWTADYLGDANNNATSSPCGAEMVVITKATPSITTIPSEGGVIGTVINDTATLYGGMNPTGDVVFKLYAPTDPNCSGAPVYTQTATTSPYATTGGYTSLMAGTYNWTADYLGDANNSATSSPCGAEMVIITEPNFEYCSPGYWKQSQHFGSWIGYSPSQTFSSVFGETITIMWSDKGKPAPVTDPTLLQALQANGGEINMLARATVGALLNSTSLDSGFTSAEVISIFQEAYNTNTNSAFQETAAMFTLDEECPLGRAEVVTPPQSLLGALFAQDFGVVNYDTNFGLLKGYSAGFGVASTTLASSTSVVVKLYAAGNVLLQTNTAIIPKFNADITGVQFSSPFDVFGNFNYGADGYWNNHRELEYGQTLLPTKVVANVTLGNGKIVTAENTILTGDTSIIFSQPLLLPNTNVAPPELKTNNGNSSQEKTNNGNGNRK